MQGSNADDRLELAALLYDQAGVQKVIDRLTAMKALLPEKVEGTEEGASNRNRRMKRGRQMRRPMFTA